MIVLYSIVKQLECVTMAWSQLQSYTANAQVQSCDSLPNVISVCVLVTMCMCGCRCLHRLGYITPSPSSCVLTRQILNAKYSQYIYVAGGLQFLTCLVLGCVESNVVYPPTPEAG